MFNSNTYERNKTELIWQSLKYSTVTCGNSNDSAFVLMLITFWRFVFLINNLGSTEY